MPDDADRTRQEPFWWAAHVNELVQDGKTARAIRLLNRFLDLGLDRDYVLLYKVQLLQTLGRVKEAIAWVCLEAELRPGDPKILSLKDELMNLYPYSLFEPGRPTPDLLAAFRAMNSDWPDVAGMQEIKIQLHNDVILPLRHREKFKRFKVGLPNGILFYGPPGCGKTYLAEKLAGKIGYRFCPVETLDIGSPYIHETSLKVSRVFKEAETNGPTLLYVDELDSLVTDRDSLGTGPYRVEEVNEFLKQMNNCSERNLLVVATCNSIERLDSAILRPGRFDIKVFIGPPDEAARHDLLRYFLHDRPRSDAIDFAILVGRTEGYSNADIRRVADEAAKVAALEDAAAITQRHLLRALDAVPSSLPRKDKPKSSRIGF
jgi:transitional endoplasmic reticulum ATPase